MPSAVQIYLSLPQLQLLELQAEYHKNSHEFLSKNISELKENHSQKGEAPSHPPMHMFAAQSLQHFEACLHLPRVFACFCRATDVSLEPEGLWGASDVSSDSKQQRHCCAHPGVHSHAVENGHERRGRADTIHFILLRPICVQILLIIFTFNHLLSVSFFAPSEDADYTMLAWSVGQEYVLD